MMGQELASSLSWHLFQGGAAAIWRQGRRETPAPLRAPSHSLIFFQCVKPSAAQASGTLVGINSGEGNQRVFPKNALSGLWHLGEGWHLSSSLVGSCLELFQQALMTLSRLDFSRGRAQTCQVSWLGFWGRVGGSSSRCCSAGLSLSTL